MKLLLLLILLSSCSTMRQRTVVVSVYDYPIEMDSVRIPADSVRHYKYQHEIRRQEKKKNFWRGATAALVILILIDILWR